MPKIVLGTANFGNHYGVANNGILLSNADSKAIINWAQSHGINHFDTALAYGSAEELLGAHLDKSLNPAVDSKLDAKSCDSSELIVNAAKEVRKRLGISQISTLYLHNEDILKTSHLPHISEGLREVLKLGIANKIGVSVYSELSAMECKRVLPDLTVFQVPENICDRRLITSKLIQELALDGNSFIVRSIFLQGLLLMEPTSIPSSLIAAKKGLKTLIQFANSNSVSVIELCLAYAKSIPWASGIVVGVASVEQLKEIQNSSSNLPQGWDKAISTLPPEIIDPRMWRR